MTGVDVKIESGLAHRPDLKEATRALPKSLVSYSLLGASAAGVTSLVEWIDLNLVLGPVFESVFERIVFSAYYSLNLTVGALLGLVIGAVSNVAVLAAGQVERLLAGGKNPGAGRRAICWLSLSLMFALLLFQQPHVYGYVVGLVREAAKIRFTSTFVSYETVISYFVLTTLIVGCAIVSRVTRSSAQMKGGAKTAWLVGLALLIAAAYHVDSRVEVQQYEHSLHRSMFLLNFVLAAALVGSIYRSWPRKWFRRPLMKAVGGIVLTISLVFTFTHFDKNHNLKTQVFYRSTQAKQYFKLAQWALDLDRDGYSALLGGGDQNDRDSGVNPGHPEIIGDGVDNNCIGGDLTAEALDGWRDHRVSLSSVPHEAARRFNVVFIFIDTVRADHMSAYGYSRQTTPNIDRLAARSSLFVNAYTPSPSTFEAVPKFMQSSYWDAKTRVWTEVLHENGYRTILFPGRRDATLPRRINDAHIEVQSRSSDIKQTVDATIEQLSSPPADRPFCAYVYSFEPHWPYRRHDRFNFGSTLTDLYDGELAYSDYHYGRLFDWMEDNGRLDNTIIVIMSDHGESLGERGVYKHTSQLHDEQMRVPMIVYVPNLNPRRIKEYVSTIDLGSTILNLVGIPPPPEYHGISLVPLMRGEEFVPPPIFGEHINRYESPFVALDRNVNPETRKYMIISQEGFKLIYNRNYHCYELYDLKTDPGEVRNLYNRLPDKARQLRSELGRFVDIVVNSRPWDADESKYFIDGKEQ